MVKPLHLRANAGSCLPPPDALAYGSVGPADGLPDWNPGSSAGPSCSPGIGDEFQNGRRCDVAAIAARFQMPAATGTKATSESLRRRRHEQAAEPSESPITSRRRTPWKTAVWVPGA
jgi:hypothetical protein